MSGDMFCDDCRRTSSGRCQRHAQWTIPAVTEPTPARGRETLRAVPEAMRLRKMLNECAEVQAGRQPCEGCQREIVRTFAEATPPAAEGAQYPIPLNAAQERAAKEWAADDRLWTTQETVETNLRTFARVILRDAKQAEGAQGALREAYHELIKTYGFDTPRLKPLFDRIEAALAAVREGVHGHHRPR